MNSHDMDVINMEVSKALAIADLLSCVDKGFFSDTTVVNAVKILTEILVGIQARIEREEQ